MIDKRTIFEIHRLAHEGLSVRKIAKSLGMSRQTTSTYLDDPNPQRPLMPSAYSTPKLPPIPGESCH